MEAAQLVAACNQYCCTGKGILWHKTGGQCLLCNKTLSHLMACREWTWADSSSLTQWQLSGHSSWQHACPCWFSGEHESTTLQLF